jgi:hypothetical protein
MVLDRSQAEYELDADLVARTLCHHQREDLPLALAASDVLSGGCRVGWREEGLAPAYEVAPARFVAQQDVVCGLPSATRRAPGISVALLRPERTLSHPAFRRR